MKLNTTATLKKGAMKSSVARIAPIGVLRLKRRDRTFFSISKYADSSTTDYIPLYGNFTEGDINDFEFPNRSRCTLLQVIPPEIKLPILNDDEDEDYEDKLRNATAEFKNATIISD